MRTPRRCRWLSTALLTAWLAPLVPLAAGPAHGTLAGRWVNAEAARWSGPLVLFFSVDGTVLNLIPAPQFGATHRFDGRRLELTSTAGPLGPDRTPMSFMLDGDVLRQEGRAVLRRFDAGAVRPAEGVHGTWRPLVQSGMEQFWTFRSDGQVILEVGIPGTDALTGNSLKLASGTFTLRRSGEALHIEGGGTTYRFVRRPWGCFGLQGEARIPECRTR